MRSCLSGYGQKGKIVVKMYENQEKEQALLTIFAIDFGWKCVKMYKMSYSNHRGGECAWLILLLLTFLLALAG